MMINLLLSTEKLNDFQTCPLLYYYKHELKKAPARKPNYLEGGELLHEILRVYYISKLENDSSTTIQSIVDHGRNYAAQKLQLKSEEVEQVITDSLMYFNYYSGNDSWIIKGVEEPFAKELYVSDDFRIVIVGKADLRVHTMRGKGPHAIVDHKYESRFEEKLERENQPLCYSWAFEIRDFIYNRIGKQKSKKVEEKLLRPMLSYSKFQIDDWVNSTIETAYDIMHCYKVNKWPMKYRGCGFHGNKCTFYDVCNTTPDNREYKMESLFGDRGNFSVMSQ